MSKMPNDGSKQPRSRLLQGRRARCVAAISIALVFAFAAAAATKVDSNWTSAQSAKTAVPDSNWTVQPYSNWT